MIAQHRAELERMGWTVRLVDGFGHELVSRADVAVPLIREFLDPVLVDRNRPATRPRCPGTCISIQYLNAANPFGHRGLGHIGHPKDGHSLGDSLLACSAMSTVVRSQRGGFARVRQPHLERLVMPCLTAILNVRVEPSSLLDTSWATR